MPARSRPRASCAPCSPTAPSASPTATTTRGCRTPTASAARPRCSARSGDAIAFAARTAAIELNASTDNPLVFENGDVLSGGNFHGQPVAQALDFLADRAHHAAGHCRAAGRAAGESRPVPGAAGVSDRRSRAVVGLHDGADHGGLAGGGVADPGLSGQHRVDSDRRQPGGLRADGDGGGLQGAPHPRQRRARRGDRTLVRRRRASSSCCRSPRGAACGGSTNGSATSGPACRPWPRIGRRLPTWSASPRAIRDGVFDPATLG